MKSDQLQETDFLTKEEEKKLEQWEKQVINFGNLALENARKAGEVLDIIKESGLFKKKRRNKEFPQFSDFGEYAKAMFGRGKTMSYNYIHISRIMKAMEENGLNPSELGSIQNALQVYFELKRLGYYDRGRLHPLFREVLHKGIQLTENISAISEQGEIIITPESIQAAFQTIEEIATSGAYEIEGQQIPMTIGQIGVDSQASQILYENVQRRRLAVGEVIEGNKKKRFEPKVFSSNGHHYSQPIEQKKHVYMTCPEHGTTEGIALVNAGVKMDCGCYGIIEFDGKESSLVYYKEDQI